MTKKPNAAGLARRTIERRAVEAVIWGMPAVNFDLMQQAFVKIKGGANQIAYWSRPVDWKNQTLTPYRLTVPSNAPVNLYWSATAYDGATHALIRNTRWSSRPLLSDAGAAKERRRFRDSLLWAESASGQRIELGADEERRRVRSSLSLLRPREGAVRQAMGAAGH